MPQATDAEPDSATDSDDAEVPTQHEPAGHPCPSSAAKPPLVTRRGSPCGPQAILASLASDSNAVIRRSKISLSDWTRYYQQSCALYPVEPIMEILQHMLERVKVRPHTKASSSRV